MKYLFTFTGKTLYGKTFESDRMVDVGNGILTKSVILAVIEEEKSRTAKRLNDGVQDLEWKNILRVPECSIKK